MISRYLLYDSLHAWMRGSILFRAFDSAVEEGGLTFVALIRLSPILPYSVRPRMSSAAFRFMIAFSVLSRVYCVCSVVLSILLFFLFRVFFCLGTYQ